MNEIFKGRHEKDIDEMKRKKKKKRKVFSFSSIYEVYYQ